MGSYSLLVTSVLQILQQLAEETLLQKQRTEHSEDAVLKKAESNAKQIVSAARIVQRSVESFASAYERLIQSKADGASGAVRTALFLEAHNAGECIQKAVAFVASPLQCAAVQQSALE